MEKIAAMVTIYNPNIAEVKRNIKSYINDIDILYIIDNSDESYEKEFLFCDKIKYFFQNNNVGVAKALNIACDIAIKDGYTWILTMDQDSYFNKKCLSKLIADIEKINIDKVAIICPWLNTKLNYKKPKSIIDDPIDVMTSVNLLNLNIYKKIGKFREDLFIDGVDIEFCLRLHTMKYQIYRDSGIEMNHDYGDCKFVKRLGRTYTCTNHNYIRRYYIVRNYCYINDEYKDRFPKFCKQLVCQRHYIMSIIMGEKDKYRKIRNCLRGYIDYKKNIKGKYKYNN